MSKTIYGGLTIVAGTVTGISDPSGATDAVTLQYLQAFVRGLKWKDSVRAASTANINLSSPGTTIDGVTMAVNDRFLAKDQSTGSQNGIYVWNGAAVAATRALDADSAAEVSGAAVTVEQGTTNADKVFTQNADSVNLGTTALNWVALGGAASSYLAGNGLSLVGSTFAVVPKASGGLSVDGTGVFIDTSVVTRKFATLVGNGSLTTIDVAHNFGTRDVIYSVRDAGTDKFVDVADVTTPDTNTLRLVFPTAPASNAFRVIVHA